MTKQSLITIDSLMEQAQVYASAWSLVGGMFDQGNQLQVAEEEKSRLEEMLKDFQEQTDANAAPVARLNAAPAADAGLMDSHPMQPVVIAPDGCIRFKKNRIVRHLLDFSTPLGCGLNELARMDFSQEDRMQLAQLIGYSVSGYGDLSYASKGSIEISDSLAESILAAAHAQLGQDK